MGFSTAICGVPFTICEPQTVMCGPNSTHNEAHLLKRQFLVMIITKIQRFFMGALVGALYEQLANKNMNKQHVNYKGDSESGTTI